MQIKRISTHCVRTMQRYESLKSTCSLYNFLILIKCLMRKEHIIMDVSYHQMASSYCTIRKDNGGINRFYQARSAYEFDGCVKKW